MQKVVQKNSESKFNRCIGFDLAGGARGSCKLRHIVPTFTQVITHYVSGFRAGLVNKLSASLVHGFSLAFFDALTVSP